MSSAVVSTPAALGRPFVFEDEAEVGLPSSARRTALDRTAEGGCPHINLLHGQEGVQESPLARVQSALKNQKSKISPASVTPASQLEIRLAPEMVSSGVPAIDALTGGLPRGCLTEICGRASSGRTTILLAALAAATRRGEFCVVVDASDALDPQSAAAAGVDLERLLWVRCGDDIQNSHQIKPASPAKRMKSAGAPPLSRTLRQGGGLDFQGPPPDFRQSEAEHRLEQVLRATDLLLESGGFGLIVLDLGDLPPQSARRIPLTTWFRYRRAIEHTPTILLTIEQQAIAGSCSSLLLQLGDSREPRAVPCGTWPVAPLFPALTCWANEFRRFATEATTTYATNELAVPSHAHLLTGLEINAELIRSRLDRKPARSVAFATKTAWEWMNMTG